MAGSDPSLESIPHQQVIPLGQAQELLQGLGSHPGSHGNGLDAFSGQVRELPVDINAKMMPCSIIDEALIEESEEFLNSRTQGQDLVGCHRRLAPARHFPGGLCQPTDERPVLVHPTDPRDSCI